MGNIVSPWLYDTGAHHTLGRVLQMSQSCGYSSIESVGDPEGLPIDRGQVARSQNRKCDFVTWRDDLTSHSQTLTRCNCLQKFGVLLNGITQFALPLRDDGGCDTV